MCSANYEVEIKVDVNVEEEAVMAIKVAPPASPRLVATVLYNTLSCLHKLNRHSSSVPTSIEINSILKLMNARGPRHRRGRLSQEEEK